MKKRIIICCDGTWNNPEKRDVTNVVKLTRAILPKDKDSVNQIVFYDWGVGSEGASTAIQGGAMGVGLDKNIRDAYRFLVHNYISGDEIYLFGFSRGAYTARSTVGFIRNVGILKKEHAELIPKAYSMYRAKTHHPNSPKARRLRSQYSHVINEIPGNPCVPRIKFVGVWDTVGALGIPLRVLEDIKKKKYEFHDTQLSSTVEYACHAVAIDEKRIDFKPALWVTQPTPDQTVRQVWFVGVHCDIGGGYSEHKLSDIALKWMISHASKQELAFNTRYIRQLTFSRTPLYLGKLHKSRRGVYWFKGTHHRSIGKLPKCLESLNISVEKRYNEDKKYRPKKLVEYLKSK